MTLKQLSENVRTRLAGATPGQGSNYKLVAIQKVLVQVINQALKTEYFSVSLPGGDTVPEGLVLATYEDVPVVAYKDVAKAVLPAMPVKLPKGMGVQHIGKTDDAHTSFIPIPTGISQMITEEPLIDDLLGQIGYELKGMDVIFDRDITDASVVTPAVSLVTIQLVVMDITNYGEFDPLPLAPDMEADIVQKAFEYLSQQQLSDKTTDPAAEPVRQ